MSRPARVCIHLSALSHNLSKVRELAPLSKVMAIIKADGYGHGIIRVARALNEANAFGVACLEEATTLRAAGVEKPIVLLEGHYSASEFKQITDLNIDVVVHHQSQLTMLENHSVSKPINVWLKIDTGMHRLGFAPAELDDVFHRLETCISVAKPIRLMTHLATANERDLVLTGHQLQSFEEISKNKDLEKTISNSAAVLDIEKSHSDWVRPGLMLYGVSPFSDTTGIDHGLQPAMTLESKLISVKQLKEGDSVGYGASWSCPGDMPVGIVAAGYGDGYPRHAPSGTPVLVNGVRTALIGRASMDMMAIDLRNQLNAKVGDPVVLWGKGLPVEEIARAANTVPYQLLCAVHKRLRFEEEQ